MFQREWKKLWSVQRYGYYLLILFLCFVCVQIFSIYTTKLGDSYLPSDYKKLCEKLEGKELQSAYDQLEKEYESLLCSDFTMESVELYQDVLEEVKNVLSYPDYLTNVQSRSGGTLSALHTSEYDKKVYEKQKEDYKELSGKDVKFVSSHGIELFLKTDFGDAVFFFMLVLLALGLVAWEYEENMMSLFCCSYMGTAKLLGYKYLVGVIHTVILQILMQSVKFILYTQSYDFDSWNSKIQSVNGFAQSSFNGTIGEFLIVFIGIKELAGILLFSLLFFLCAYADSSLKVILLIGIVCGFFLWCTMGISVNSWLGVLKVISPFQMLCTKELLSVNRYINFFSIPIKLLDLWVVIAVILSVVFFFGGLVVFQREQNIIFIKFTNKVQKYKKSKWYQKVQKWKKVIQPKGLWYRLWKRCFLEERAVVLLLLAGLFVALTYQQQDASFTDDTEYYQYQYIKELEGTYEKKKSEWLASEQLRLDEISDEMVNNASVYSDSAMELLKQEYRKYGGLRVVSDYAEYLSRIDDGAFVYEPGYELLLGIRREQSNLFVYNLLAFFLMSMIAVAMWGREQWTGMEYLVNCSYIGVKKYRRKQRMLVIWYAAVISAVAYIPWIYNVVHGYELTVWSNSCRSIQALQQFPITLTIGGVCVLYYFLHFVYLAIMGEIARMVQKCIPSQVAATVFLFGISIIPLLWVW